MNIFLCGYCQWFPSFYKKVAGPDKRKIFLYGTLGGIKEFSNIVAFFIPLKVIMVLSNPAVLDSQLFTSRNINMQEFIYFAGFWFFFLMAISFVSHMFLSSLVHKNSRLLWQVNKDNFPSKTKYKNLYQLMVDTITHLQIIIIGSGCVLFFDNYLSIPLIIVVFLFIITAIWLSNHTKIQLLATPLREPKLVFKLLSDVGFSIIFIFIVIEYFLNNNMNFLYTLLSLILSRIILRNTQQLFIKHRRVFDDYYKHPPEV